MDRLTESLGNGQYMVRGCGENCKHNYEYCRTDDCQTVNETFEKLGQYEDVEEQGRLVKLPCAVGTTVYIPVTHYYIGFERINEKKVLQATIEEIGISERGIKVIAKNGSDIREFSPSDFGKTIFTDKPKATQSLQEMKQEQP